MATSCGIIPFRLNKNGDLEFFVGHPGGIYNAHKDYWALLKGGCEDFDGDLKETAIREFQEESSLTLTEANKATLAYLGSVRQNPHKTVHAFSMAIDDIDCTRCHSNLCPDGKTPEIDKYCWMTWDELKDKTHKTHKSFYEKIISNFYGKVLETATLYNEL